VKAEPAPEQALAAICGELVRLGRRFALVDGLAVSVRAEVRFTRDVDIVVLVADDPDAESLTYHLRTAGYSAVASVEHETRHRLSTVRLMSPSGVKVDLLFASSGIEPEIVDRATPPGSPQRGREGLHPSVVERGAPRGGSDAVFSVSAAPGFALHALVRAEQRGRDAMPMT
jgi:hypothetical protein